MEPSLRQAFYDDVYSHAFNVLRYLGQWNVETKDASKRRLYGLYKSAVAVLGLFLVTTALVDLYLCRFEKEKVVFNMCTTMLITGIWIKNQHVRHHSCRLNQLRLSLFKDGWSQRKNPEYVKIRQKFLKILLDHRKVLYVAAYILLPLWLATSLTTLVWGPRQLPFSVWTPFDLEDNFQFFCGFFYQSVCSIFIVAETIQADIAMFSLLLQIATQYRVLGENVREIDDLYVDRSLEKKKTKRDINKILVSYKTKQKLRECAQKQLTLMRYIQELENVYSKPMMIQLICGFVLSIGNGLELLVVSVQKYNTNMHCGTPILMYSPYVSVQASMNLSLKLSYQIGYSIIVLADVFMCCNLADLLITQGREVVRSLYDIVWYEMDSDLRKYLVMAIMGAQKMQPLTAAKMFQLNLRTFLMMLKNIYSWLALFRQLLLKK